MTPTELPSTRFGRDGPQVTRLCQGTAFRTLQRDPSDRRATAVLHHSLDRGVRFFDSSNAYGWGGPPRPPRDGRPPIPPVECEEKICHCPLMDDWGEGSDRQKAAAGPSGSGCASTMVVALGLVALLILALLIAYPRHFSTARGSLLGSTLSLIGADRCQRFGLAPRLL